MPHESGHTGPDTPVSGTTLFYALCFAALVVGFIVMGCGLLAVFNYPTSE